MGLLKSAFDTLKVLCASQYCCQRGSMTEGSYLLKAGLSERQGVEARSHQRDGIGGHLAHVADAQRVDDPRPRPLPAGVDSRDQVGCALVLEALQRDDLLGREVVEVRHVGDEPDVEELLHRLVAEALDVHAAA